jgi:beta-glucosidase
VRATLLTAQARAAAALHELDPGCQVGLSHHVILMQPASSSTLDAAAAALADDWANEAVPRAVKTGRVRLQIPGVVDLDEPIPQLQGSFDYFGINQYYRAYVRADLLRPSLTRVYVPEDAEVHDLGGEIYPEGMYRVLHRFSAFGWPIVITENGVADGADQWRPQFLRGVFHALRLAHGEGVDVRGYLHWSLMDNFEWGEGYRARFGLYAVDGHYRRVPRPSVEIFRRAALTVRRE